MHRMTPLERERREQGLTQEQLIARIGRREKSAISYIENGLTPSPDLQRRLADALGVPVEKLFPTASPDSDR